MTIKKYHPTKLFLALLITTGLSACDNQTTGAYSHTITPAPSHHEATVNTAITTKFISGEMAAKRLATEDDYIKRLTPFDWQAKFKSNRPLNSQELHDYYANAVLDWDAASKQKIQTAVDLLEQRIANLNLNKPETLTFILSNGLVESGAAYTREDYIVLPTNMIDDTQTQDDINHLVAHEFFHVYSRFNKNHRDELYGTINFKNLPPVSLPSYIKSLVITNPDAPKMGYGIDLEYQGNKKGTFLPLLMSHSEYDTKTNLSFFAYVRDGLLLVEDAKGVMRPTLVNGAPVFISKDRTNYDALVQTNSSYLGHPEEVLAENFSMWVVDRDLKHKEPVDRLINTMKAIR